MYSTKPYPLFSLADKIGISLLGCFALGCLGAIVVIVNNSGAF